jgi:hypothetical protein
MIMEILNKPQNNILSLTAATEGFNESILIWAPNMP